MNKFDIEYKQDNLISELNGIKPFLKWAGGKTQLLKELLEIIPPKFNKYIEPFVGGGALFFYINHKKSIVSDLNEDLIITYIQVRDNVNEIIEILEDYKNDEKFYYKIRSIDPTKVSEPERAARLIYLNKTCFNGLFRVNKKGIFNVPFGKRKGSFFDKYHLIKASNYLKGKRVYHSDYKNTLRIFAKNGDFVFLDPPYFPVGKYSDFKRYTKEFFYENDQVDLKLEFDSLVERGCYVLLTNSDNPLIIDLYKDYEIKVVKTKRLISCNPETRTGNDIIVIGKNG